MIRIAPLKPERFDTAVSEFIVFHVTYDSIPRSDPVTPGTTPVRLGDHRANLQAALKTTLTNFSEGSWTTFNRHTALIARRAYSPPKRRTPCFPS